VAALAGSQQAGHDGFEMKRSLVAGKKELALSYKDDQQRTPTTNGHDNI
jgi:hypothetical protein